MSENRLAREKSPYLLQHRHNPVDWYPWGEEAFEKARRENKPIFLSVGYSTCHWCHVMERESFENDAIAALLNEHFVSIKVDREERPDVDRVYMAFVQATTGGGGWPMSVFLTPRLTPFVGGTYFPPEDRWQRLGFPTVLRRVAEAWAGDAERLIAHGEKAIGSLRQAVATGEAKGGWEALAGSGGALVERAVEHFVEAFDSEEGGFSNAPKFPRPAIVTFLLRYAASGGGRLADAARNAALFTLRKMAAGGMNDHLGGGFHRYSVDRFWHIPHFEKMLYDQGQLAVAYTDAFQLTGDPRYAAVARETLDYLLRDMMAPGGAFYSAEDADSPLPEHPDEKGEGAFYVWTEAEIDAALGAEGVLFKRAYGVEPSGNAPPESDPSGEFAGKNTLIRRRTDEELARETGLDPETVTRSLAESRRTLLRLRGNRPRPHLDDKIVTAWNGLAISAFARAAQAIGNPADLAAAGRAARFLRENLQRGGRLLRSYRDGPGAVGGFADDYAFLIQGLLDLYEAGGAIEWVQWASELQRTLDALFWDDDCGGWFSTTGDDPSILLRAKEDYDGAEPAANSVAALNALRLGAMLDDEALRRRGEAAIAAFLPQLRRFPGALPKLLEALLAVMEKPRFLVLAGRLDATPGDPLDVHPLLRAAQALLLPGKALLFADGGPGQAWLGERLEFMRTAIPVNGNASAYLCVDQTCQAPVTNPDALVEILKT